jgi:hypothetical protein
MKPSDTIRGTVVSANVFAACPISIALEYVSDYLRHAEDGGSQAIVHASVRLLQRSLGTLSRRVDLSFSTHADEGERGRAHDEIHVQWSAHSRLLPDFRGVIQFRTHERGTDILVDGSYHPPFGALGRAFDDWQGRKIAQTTVNDLATRLASYMEACERDFRARYAESDQPLM